MIWLIIRKWPIYRLSITCSINSPQNQASRLKGATWRWKGTKAHKKVQRLLQKSNRNQNIYSTLFSLLWHVIIRTCWQVMFLAADFILLSDTSPSSWPWSLTLSLVFFFLGDFGWLSVVMGGYKWLWRMMGWLLMVTDGYRWLWDGYKWLWGG